MITEGSIGSGPISLTLLVLSIKGFPESLNPETGFEETATPIFVRSTG